MTFRIAERWLTSLDALRQELEKCQLLCRPCHNLKTLAEMGKKPVAGTHGTLSAYRHTSCRCPLCRKAMSDYNRKRYLEKGPRKSKRKQP